MEVNVMAVNDVLKMALVGRVGQDDIVVTHHFRQLDGSIGFTPPDQELADLWVANAQDLFLGLCCPDYALDYVSVKNLSGGTDEVVVEIDENGSQSGQCIANFVSPLVSLRTGMAGRSNRGRNYLPPCSEGNVNGNNIEDAMATAIRAYYDAILVLGTIIIDTRFHLTVFSRTLETDRLVTSYLVRTPLATQRRRRIGVGS
jgi:hypothetical protein